MFFYIYIIYVTPIGLEGWNPLTVSFCNSKSPSKTSTLCVTRPLSSIRNHCGTFIIPPGQHDSSMLIYCETSLVCPITAPPVIPAGEKEGEMGSWVSDWAADKMNNWYKGSPSQWIYRIQTDAQTPSVPQPMQSPVSQTKLILQEM